MTFDSHFGLFLQWWRRVINYLKTIWFPNNIWSVAPGCGHYNITTLFVKVSFSTISSWHRYFKKNTILKQSMFTPYCQFFFCQLSILHLLALKNNCNNSVLSIRLSNFGRGLMIQLLFLCHLVKILWSLVINKNKIGI